jgi:poly(3-hydroxybutyrate) depolymerase
MNPDRHLKSHYDYFKDLIKGDNSSIDSHRDFYDEYNAVLDMDADYYLETITTVFQEFKLVRGTWEVKNPEGQLELVRPQDIRTTALLTVEGELDDISGSGQTEAAHKLCSGIVRQAQHHLEAKGAGHYGIFSGRRWRDVVYPHVKSFILANSQAEGSKTSGRVAARPQVAAKKAAPVMKKAAPAAKKAVAKRVAKKAPAAPK